MISDREKLRAKLLRQLKGYRTQTATLGFTLRIRTTQHDSLEVLADALAGDLYDAAQQVHGVAAWHGTVKINGKRLPPLHAADSRKEKK